MEVNNMFNWSHDIPKDSKLIFINILELLRSLKNPRILEIGTYVGVSLIEMLRQLPHATGYAIDNWSISQEECPRKKDLKQTFIQNVNNANIRVFLMETDSHQALLNIIKNSENFDFIYVDGNHNNFHAYMDIKLSWEILSANGILGIDDYTPECKNNTNNISEAVDYFLTQIKNYEILSNEKNRIFLRKTA